MANDMVKMRWNVAISLSCIRSPESQLRFAFGSNKHKYLIAIIA